MSFDRVMHKLLIISFIALPLTSTLYAKSIYVHYMPWFQTQGCSGSWWHWGDTIPRQKSHYTPLVGLYDSRDPDVHEYQVLEMKIAGIDGIIMDWYGINNGLPEYGTQPIFQTLAKAGMNYAICWEDRFANDQGGAAPVLRFMEENFFKTEHYLKINGRPLLLTWQHIWTSGDQWQQNMNSVSFQNKPILITRDEALKPAAEGAYGWINAPGGTMQVMPGIDYLLKQSVTYKIPAALPRFVDMYDVSYGTIEDLDGEMFVNTLTRCLGSACEITQIATWNDWQEGTIIEPSVEFQYRDLEVIQRMRRTYIDPQFSYTPEHLRLPVRIFLERKRFKGNAKETARLDSASNALFRGQPDLAVQYLDGKSSVKPAGFRTTRPADMADAAVYDIKGRLVQRLEAAGSKTGRMGRLPASGVYLVKTADGHVASRLTTPVR
jgi:hypothetical protein